jgi:hypothetical protein
MKKEKVLAALSLCAVRINKLEAELMYLGLKIMETDDLSEITAIQKAADKVLKKIISTALKYYKLRRLIV